MPRHQVYHIDFGDTDMVSDENIRMLPREFRELPAQAIKAKIAGKYLIRFIFIFILNFSIYFWIDDEYRNPQLERPMVGD